MRVGRDMNLTSVSAKEIYVDLKDKDKYKGYVKCNRCNGKGSLRNILDGKIEICSVCKGYGFYKE